VWASAGLLINSTRGFVVYGNREFSSTIINIEFCFSVFILVNPAISASSEQFVKLFDNIRVIFSKYKFFNQFITN